MAYLLVNPLTCQLVNLKFRQRVDFITRVTLSRAFCFRSLGFQQQSLGKIYDTLSIFMCKPESGIDMLLNDACA